MMNMYSVSTVGSRGKKLNLMTIWRQAAMYETRLLPRA